jgi:hypothetical protein
VVINLVVPAVIPSVIVISESPIFKKHVQQRLVPISPREILRPDVLVRILDPLLQRRQMLPVFPMLVPKVPGIDAAEDEAGGHDTGEGLVLLWLLGWWGLERAY